MKRIITVLGIAALVVGLTGPIGAQEKGQAVGKPVNTMCPLKPKSKATPTLIVKYKGKIIGFCCEDCVDKFKVNPAGYMSRVVEDADPNAGPDNVMASPKAALEAGKSGGYVVVLLFATPKSKSAILWNRLLTDPLVYQQLLNTAYSPVTFKRSDPLAKQFKVTRAPALLIIDPRGEKPKVIKKITRGNSRTVSEALKAANAKVLGGE